MKNCKNFSSCGEVAQSPRATFCKSCCQDRRQKSGAQAMKKRWSKKRPLFRCVNFKTCGNKFKKKGSKLCSQCSQVRNVSRAHKVLWGKRTLRRCWNFKTCRMRVSVIGEVRCVPCQDRYNSKVEAKTTKKIREASSRRQCVNFHVCGMHSQSSRSKFCTQCFSDRRRVVREANNLMTHASWRGA